ncbi:MAG TPA: alpha-amylase family glycosyl hydrolase [Thermoanaerobaculia bacterium]|jgi:glycosidase|nr:alpha-amylase family glycosyl hydrolase [Thermoanaerobaculia bacterium]
MTPPVPPTAVTLPPPPALADHDWLRGAVFYEVFVRSFADSNGDGVGDIRGLTAKLDYLNDGNPATTSDLGVDALWLMPVFQSPSYHGYDTVDYERIDDEYGTAEDFQRLLDEAHKRGIRIIVDFVMNHSSDKHPWFVESASSVTSPKRDWYVWRADDPGWTHPWGGDHDWYQRNGAFYYGVFWSGMPDLNFSTTAVRQEMERLATLWISRGVDGFRLDATRHLFANGPGDLQNDQPETFEYLKEFAASVRKANPRAVVVGENWTETPIIAKYYQALPMSFDFPLAEEILAGVKDGEAAGIANKLDEILEIYPPGAIDAPFLTNHDMVRFATVLGDDPAKLRSAAALLLTLPGAPFLYYGEEVGLLNGPGGPHDDEYKRTPMPWDASETGGFTTGKPWFGFAPGKETANVAAQTGDPGSLLSHYRNLIRTRKASIALQKGDLKILTSLVKSDPVLAFVRQAGNERVLVVHNLGKTEAEAGPYAIDGDGFEPIFATGNSADIAAPTPADGGWKVKLPAGASAVWKIQ